MAEARSFVVRPLPSQLRAEVKNLLRVYVSLANIHLLGLVVEGPCMLKSNAGLTQAVYVSPTTEIKDSVIQTSKGLQDLHHIKLGESVTLIKASTPIQEATDIRLFEVRPDDTGSSWQPLSYENRTHWAWLLEDILERTELVSPGISFDNIVWRRQNRKYRIGKINGSSDIATYRFNQSCKVAIDDEDPKNTDVAPTGRIWIPLEGLDALKTQIDELNRELASYNVIGNTLKPFWYQRPRGILLHGPPGTGKTLLLKRISEAGWSKVFHVDSESMGSSRIDEKKAAIRKVFADAFTCQPSLIVIDDLETLAGKDECHLQKTLRKMLEELGNDRVLVVAATRVITDIDNDLVNVDRFSLTLELPVPDTKSRARILGSLMGVPRNLLIDFLANKTHGFVRNDLKQLILSAEREAKARMSCLDSPSDLLSLAEEEKVTPTIVDEDFTAALRKLRPRAMRELYVETPSVDWRDIKGQTQIKKILEHVLVWPYKYADQMRAFDVEYGKGLLLYGPPGCSKTMIARAAATQSGHNFLAVKGAELLNMYVGESERAIRELFRKARSISPSIIFFDEIDSIGTARDGAQQSSLNVVTTLLNEIDGIEELKGVFVLAATNRPDVMDPALTRAGRLDTMIYVGPPDLEARQLIIQDRLRKVTCAADVDTMSWAGALEGYSGAEVAYICQVVKEAALEDYLEESSTGRVSSNTELDGDNGEIHLMRSCRIRQQHFDRAFSQVKKAITPEMLAYYETFAASAKTSDLRLR